MKRILFTIIPVLLLCNAVIAEEPQSQLSTHILDISEGKPAEGVIISLYKYDSDRLKWRFIDKVATKENGHADGFLPYTNNNYGAYKLRFETEEYFRQKGLHSIYPYIEVAFKVEDESHYHIPLVVSANGYSTYRGN